MDILTIFDDSELRRVAVYPILSHTCTHTSIGKVSTMVGILILVLLICAKFKVQRNQLTNRLSYGGHL